MFFFFFFLSFSEKSPKETYKKKNFLTYHFLVSSVKYSYTLFRVSFHQMCPLALRDIVFHPFQTDLGSFSGLGAWGYIASGWLVLKNEGHLWPRASVLCSREQVADISEVIEGCPDAF